MMDEFAIDLDKVLDEFEQSEVGDAAEADSVRRNEVRDEIRGDLESAELDQPRPAVNFPVFEALDLDLAEADFAPSNFNFGASPSEDDGIHSFSDPPASNVDAAAADFPIRELEPLQNNDDDGYRVPVDVHPAVHIPGEVDVLSACRRAVVGPPVVQEHRENEAENEVPAAPPDIVCSAPDLVSSVIVGVDVVPLSCAGASVVGNVNSSFDLAPAQPVPDTVHVNVERPVPSVLDSLNHGADRTANSSVSSAENRELRDVPHDEGTARDVEMGLADGKHLGEPSDYHSDTKDSAEAFKKPNVLASSFSDVVSDLQCSDDASSGYRDLGSSDKSPPFLSEEDKSDENITNGCPLSASSSPSIPSDMLRSISEANDSSASYTETTIRSGIHLSGMVDRKDKCTGDFANNDVNICSSDFDETIRSHDAGQEPLPDVSRVSVSGVEREKDEDSVSDVEFKTPHESFNGPDESCNRDTDREMNSANSDHSSDSIGRNGCSPEVSLIRNKMPPAYWDDAEGDETQESGVGQSCEKLGDLSNEFGQTDDVSEDENNVNDKVVGERMGEGGIVALFGNTDAESSEIEDEGCARTGVEPVLKQETSRVRLNDPEIIKDGKVADTNFAEDRLRLEAPLHDGICTSHEIRPDGFSEVPTEKDLESLNLREEIKYDLDLVSDVVMLESLPEFCSTGDAACPDVAYSDNNSNKVKFVSSEDDNFAVINGQSAQESSAISESLFPEAFGVLEDETLKDLMSEVAEEMERMMMNQENTDAEVIRSHEDMNDFNDVGKNHENNDFDKTHRNVFEDQDVGSENQREAEIGVSEVVTELADDASHDVLNHRSAELKSHCHQKEASNSEKPENSHNQPSTDVKEVDTVESRLPFPEPSGNDFPRETASDAKVSQVSAVNENILSPSGSTQNRPSSEFSTGARQKQAKTVNPEDISVVTDVLSSPAETAVMSTDTQPITAVTAATQGAYPRPTSLLQTSTSSHDFASPTIPLCSNIALEITQLGKVAPVWLPDAEASKCMECEIPFSFTRRRHHCRACGKVFCHGCSSLRVMLPYLENKLDRVCSKCYQDLVRASYYERTMPGTATRSNTTDSDSSSIQAQATADVQHQPSVATPPASVLRKQGSMKLSGEAKQVMFSDGVRPGGSLTELDGSSETRTTSSRRSRKSDKSSSQATSASQVRNSAEARRANCLISSSGLLPLVIPASNGEFSLKDDVPPDVIFQQISNAQDSNPVTFAINRDVAVMVKIVNLDCCVNRLCWCFTTKGLCNVGQDEIVIVLECLPDEKTVPVDVLRHLHVVYEMASHGNTINNLDHTVLPTGSLGYQETGGFLYIRQTFQCLQKLILPDPPYLFGLLLQKWEMSWAKVFPLRLMFRLGAEFRYYPCPLISVRHRKPVYGEVGHTIMNLLADFHNYQYMVPRINGLVIHMEDKRTVVSIPQNRHKMLLKILSNSDDHVIALGASFSSTADSHLVCLQSEDGNYQTQAINIQNRPRRITGACFIVFNGALKPTSGLRAKSSIVEDGLMIQVTSDAMTELKQALSEMKDYKILCGSVEIAQPDEMVIIEWNNEEKNINQGVKSPIDGLSMFGVDSIRIHGSTDYAKEKLSIRWTEVFVLRNGAANDTAPSEAPTDVSHLAETLAQACCQALVNHLSQLAFEMLTKIGLRVTIDSEQVGYEIGSRGIQLPGFCMNDLDEKLISVIHGAASNAQSGPIVLELIFHIIQPYGAHSVTNATSITN